MKKLSVVIGNGNYPDSPLSNPANDAKDIAEKLAKLGFSTIVRFDATNSIMEEALTDFSVNLSNCDVALFFFAGHGMQIDGKNYLTAINTNFDREIDAKYSSLPLDKVIEIMEKGSNKTAIIMLDACRTNPYERKWRGEGSRGLAPVYAPRGMIIGYATSPGQVAYDGDEKNGAYTDAILRHISTPDIAIENFFKRVRNTLSSLTGGRQISWEHTSLMGDFFFNYSFVSEELMAEYGEKAIADAEYIPSSGDMAREIIGGLKSYNWYQQNPAVKKISSSTLYKFKKDDLFVLGRNIYQAACGTASEAINYLDNFQNNLSSLDKQIAFHLLNGVLFEIYFDSKGERRVRHKSEMIDPVFQVEDSDYYKDSFEYIKQALKPFYNSLFYIPSSLQSVSVDVSCKKHDNELMAINAIYFEGDNILYDDSGEDYYDPAKEGFLSETKKEKIKQDLSEKMIVPSFRLKVNFLNLLEGTDTILVPYSLKLKRLS